MKLLIFIFFAVLLTRVLLRFMIACISGAMIVRGTVQAPFSTGSKDRMRDASKVITLNKEDVKVIEE